MNQILFIPGFATKLTSPIIRTGQGTLTGCGIFSELIKTGKASLFDWGIQEHVCFLKLINPFFILRLYKSEQHLATDFSTTSRLQLQILTQQPSVIICHSMGSVILLALINNHALPECVKRIVFIQSDTDSNSQLPPDILIFNLYCPWDPSLILSSLFARKWKQGLRPRRQPNVKNIFFPLWKPINLHTSSIRDRKILKTGPGLDSG